MKNYATKFKHIVPTFLFVVVASTLFVLLFRWVFTINANILPIKEDIFDMWVPIIFPWIPITIWLTPKLKVLKFNRKGSDAPLLFKSIAWATMTVMMMISNSYLKTATGSLAEINTIEEAFNPNASYLKINDFEVDRDYGSSHTEFRTSGKYGRRLNFDSYFVYPLKVESAENKFKYWYGVEMHEQISKSLEPEVKEEKYQVFIKQAVEDFKNYKFYEADYFEIVPHSIDRDGFIDAIKRQENLSDIQPVIIRPKKGLYTNKNGHKLGWIFGSFAIGFSIFLFVLKFPVYSTKK